ncbi:MAG: hypothetical protein KN64_01415 [Sulfurovum sp. AS07-7]|jgi:hypothetical protein|nr:MAG: hypothetical protein KN64_01415 [Sulfurovum sp. AS07-7]
MTIGIRELSRNTKIMDNYDYIEIEDKKTHEKKGLLISPKYAEEFKKLLDKKINAEKQAKVNKIMQFIGIANGEFTNSTKQDIKKMKAQRDIND